MPETFTPKTWVDGVAGGTPIIATELNRIEVGIESMDDRVAALEALTVPVVTLADGATVALDASLGRVFKLTATASRTILATSNPIAGQRITIVHATIGGPWTLTLTTGSAGAFQFGATITALSATTANLTDYIDCIYDSTAARFRVIGYAKGFS